MKRLAMAAGAIAFCLLAQAPAFAAGAHEAMMKGEVANAVKKWLSNPMLIAAVKKQNEKNASIAQSEIDRLDKKWRAEVKASGGELTKAVLSNELSSFLKGVKARSKGLYTEIFVMDAKGLNVGQSDVTSDYWQGDEAKWQKTFAMGPDAMHVSKVEMDESTQTLQSQLSMSVVDPATKKVIGAVTVGVNVDLLGQ